MENEKKEQNNKKWIVWAAILLLLLLGFGALRNVFFKPEPIDVNMPVPEATTTTEGTADAPAIEGAQPQSSEMPQSTQGSTQVGGTASNMNGTAPATTNAASPAPAASTAAPSGPVKYAVSGGEPGKTNATPPAPAKPGSKDTIKLTTGGDEDKVDEQTKLVYAVYAGTFSSEANGTNLKNKLTKEGYPKTRNIVFDINGKKTYKVIVDKYDTKEEANIVVEKLKAKGYEARSEPQRVMR